MLEERAEGRRESFLVVVSHLLFPKLYLSFLEVLWVLFKLCMVIPPPIPFFLSLGMGPCFPLTCPMYLSCTLLLQILAATGLRVYAMLSFPLTA